MHSPTPAPSSRPPPRRQSRLRQTGRASSRALVHACTCLACPAGPRRPSTCLRRSHATATANHKAIPSDSDPAKRSNNGAAILPAKSGAQRPLRPPPPSALSGASDLEFLCMDGLNGSQHAPTKAQNPPLPAPRRIVAPRQLPRRPTAQRPTLWAAPWACLGHIHPSRAPVDNVCPPGALLLLLRREQAKVALLTSHKQASGARRSSSSGGSEAGRVCCWQGYATGDDWRDDSAVAARASQRGNSFMHSSTERQVPMEPAGPNEEMWVGQVGANSMLPVPIAEVACLLPREMRMVG